MAKYMANPYGKYGNTRTPPYHLVGATFDAVFGLLEVSGLRGEKCKLPLCSYGTEGAWWWWREGGLFN